MLHPSVINGRSLSHHVTTRCFIYLYPLWSSQCRRNTKWMMDFHQKSILPHHLRLWKITTIFCIIAVAATLCWATPGRDKMRKIQGHPPSVKVSNKALASWRLSVNTDSQFSSWRKVEEKLTSHLRHEKKNFIFYLLTYLCTSPDGKSRKGQTLQPVIFKSIAIVHQKIDPDVSREIVIHCQSDTDFKCDRQLSWNYLNLGIDSQLGIEARIDNQFFISHLRIYYH